MTLEPYVPEAVEVGRRRTATAAERWDKPTLPVPGAGVIPVRVTREFMYLRRPVLVAVSLADLRGQASGVVELPLHLFWSGRDSRDSRFSLDDLPGRRMVYRTVLREARYPDDLLSPGFALAVLGGYAAIAMTAASLRASHRDA